MELVIIAIALSSSEAAPCYPGGQRVIVNNHASLLLVMEILKCTLLQMTLCLGVCRQ